MERSRCYFLICWVNIFTDKTTQEKKETNEKTHTWKIILKCQIKKICRWGNPSCLCKECTSHNLWDTIRMERVQEDPRLQSVLVPVPHWWFSLGLPTQTGWETELQTFPKTFLFPFLPCLCWAGPWPREHLNNMDFTGERGTEVF